MKIRTKLILVLILVSLPPLVAVAVIARTTARQALRQNIGEASLQIAELAAGGINEYLYHQWDDVRSWSATHEEFARVNEGDGDGEISALLTKLTKSHSEFSYMICVDRDGSVVAASDKRLRGAQLAKDQGFKNALGGQSDMRDAGYDDLVQGYTLKLSAPIRDQADPSTVVGVLSCAIDWNSVCEMVHRLRIRGQPQDVANHIMLVNKDGLGISCREGAKMFSENLIALGMRSALEAQQGRKGYLTEISEHGIRSLSAYTPMERHADLPDLEWTVVLLQDADALFSSVTAMDKVILFAVIGTIVCVIVASFLIIRTISKPILSLADAADNIRAGNHRKVEVESKDEIGILASSFNRMAAELAERTEELQDEVAERKQAEQQIQNYATVLENNNLALEEFNEAVEAANRAKSEFLANMSHEIRTPMTAILGFSEILHENIMCCSICAEHQSCRLREQNKSHVETIRANGEHLIRIINDILDLSKIEAGKLEVEHIQCSPRRILSEVASLMRVRANAKNLPLEIECDGPIPQSIQSDPTRLRQILINLTGNAVKFTEVGKVRLVARLLDAQSDESKMQFEIVDSGIGMTGEQIARLFKPFHQADTSTTRKFGGTGLGLAISKRLAEKLGGDITVRSTPGEGTTFTVTVGTGPSDGVKLLDNPTEAEVSTDPDKRPAAPEIKLDCRVLLAEDGPDNQRLISFILKKAGAQVTLAENGQIACRKAIEASDVGSPFDVILMDMQMPIMDGYEATRKLRENGCTGPIIALTAHAMDGDRDRCIRAGCDNYASKPIDRGELIGIVSQYSRRSGAVCVASAN